MSSAAIPSRDIGRVFAIRQAGRRPGRVTAVINRAMSAAARRIRQQRGELKTKSEKDMNNPEKPRNPEVMKNVRRDIEELRKSTEDDLLEQVLYEANALPESDAEA